MSNHSTSAPGAPSRPSTPARRPRNSNGRPRPAGWFLRAALVVCLCVALPTPGLALLHFDPTEPPFDNSILVPFGPSDAASGARQFTITRAGVQFTFSSTSANSVFFCDAAGNCRLQTQGVDVDINPPVAAIGF